MTSTTAIEVLIKHLASDIHSTALSKGFWETPHPFIGEINTKLVLIVSEVAEAMETLRKGYDDSVENPYSHMTEMQGEDFLEEVIDVIIRAFDLAFYFEGVHGNVADIMLEKMQRNANRPRKHGKRF